jgi:hypothetical protein
MALGKTAGAQAKPSTCELGHPSNGSEGLWAKAGKRRSRLEDAVNSARETSMALRLAGACGYLAPEAAAAERAELDGIIAVLWTLTYKR